jgi:hypothetical protein
LLPQIYHAAGWADTGLDNMGKGWYTEEEFKQTFMQPMQLFTVAVPVQYLSDLNKIWRDGSFSPEKTAGINLPAAFIYSDYYAGNVKNIKEHFTKMPVCAEQVFTGASTIELMLSGAVSAAVTATAAAMSNGSSYKQ